MASTILTIALLIAPSPIPDMAGWEADWHARLALTGALTIELVTERRTILGLEARSPALRPPVRLKPETRPPAAPPNGVEHWRPLVATYFHPDHVDRALRVMACESLGDPNARNPRSSAAGLFQFIRSTWDWQASILGLPTYDQGGPLNPDHATRAAANLSRGGADWSHWVCKP